MGRNFALLVTAQTIFLVAVFAFHISLLFGQLGGENDFALIAWSVYMIWWSVYHVLEFVMTAVFNRAELKWNSFLLDQSKEYVIALALSVVEFWLELFLFGQQKRAMCGIAGGAVLLLFACIMWLGQITRSVGMATAGFAFTHQIQDRQRQGHELVTHGIYSILRHPGYTGWFYASIATQCVLCNPVCAVLYCWAAWRFFARRIPHEEYKLYTMFGQKYLQYRYESFVLIPFIPSPLDVLGRGKTD